MSTSEVDSALLSNAAEDTSGAETGDEGLGGVTSGGEETVGEETAGEETAGEEEEEAGDDGGEEQQGETTDAGETDREEDGGTSDENTRKNGSDNSGGENDKNNNKNASGKSKKDDDGEFTDDEEEENGSADKKKLQGSITGPRFHAINPAKITNEPEVALKSIGSVYQGDWEHGRMDGFGRYTFSNGNYYVGHFADGQFEGEGTLFFPGRGKYVGVWHDGRATSGDFIFCDNLLYKEDEWEYCTGSSRVFWSEIEDGVKPAGAEQVHSTHPRPKAPIGSYDVGDGWYYPKTRKVYTYDNKYLRTPTEEQVEWILSRCRLVEEQ